MVCGGVVPHVPAWPRPPGYTQMAEEEGGGGGSISADDGGPGASGGAKVVVVKQVALPWDPLSSTDWNGESHTKEALLRIKRYCN